MIWLNSLLKPDISFCDVLDLSTWMNRGTKRAWLWQRRRVATFLSLSASLPVNEVLQQIAKAIEDAVAGTDRPLTNHLLPCVVLRGIHRPRYMACGCEIKRVVAEHYFEWGAALIMANRQGSNARFWEPSLRRVGVRTTSAHGTQCLTMPEASAKHATIVWESAVFTIVYQKHWECVFD